MNRGSPDPPDRCPGAPSGFNEAPIHESGKYRRASESAHASARFNEAPIHESGKFRIPGPLHREVAWLQ